MLLFAGLRVTSHHRKPNWLPANGVKHRPSSSSSYSPFIFWVKLVIMSFFSYLACNYRFWFFLIRIVVVIVNFCPASNIFLFLQVEAPVFLFHWWVCSLKLILFCGIYKVQMDSFELLLNLALIPTSILMFCY